MPRWSKTRQMLEEEYLCEALRGRVRYFATRYRHAHDGRGRVSVLVDGKEVLNMHFATEYQANAAAHARWDNTREEPLQTAIEAVEQSFAEEGRFAPGDFGAAVENYLQSDIAAALASPDLLVRMLAMMDRRVGRRTLMRQMQLIALQPPWLQGFYRLRLEAEGLACPPCVASL